MERKENIDLVVHATITRIVPANATVAGLSTAARSLVRGSGARPETAARLAVFLWRPKAGTPGTLVAERDDLGRAVPATEIPPIPMQGDQRNCCCLLVS
ncbi:hypothetical protein [Sinorhizobium fredii]|uniref:Uncharacterized protein n=1 Tax=Rhizobium fredii TaxID=380 RepID=A0A2L0HGI1_RHIFR|nr:hypothetical protein [Sinorhizobium fredii]AUX80611.1 hypothetical protein NXT3_PC01463 [Sinorhizobium fredii]